MVRVPRTGGVRAGGHLAIDQAALPLKRNITKSYCNGIDQQVSCTIHSTIHSLLATHLDLIMSEPNSHSCYHTRTLTVRMKSRIDAIPSASIPSKQAATFNGNITQQRHTCANRRSRPILALGLILMPIADGGWPGRPAAVSNRRTRGSARPQAAGG